MVIISRKRGPKIERRNNYKGVIDLQLCGHLGYW